MSDAAKMKLDREKAGLMVIDVQEKLGAAMQPEGLDWIVGNTGILMQAAKVLGVPLHFKRPRAGEKAEFIVFDIEKDTDRWRAILHGVFIDGKFVDRQAESCRL